ncbi:MAG TPA: hypothetical protein DEQ34_03090 [Balneolaceae bacterium]|nr:hypothetical protein [Balneolaceae bacterium]|tara:strand:+ start:71239 stop:71733 length:495 start_codon:yes stop_codon:yes gene_type:complete
MNNVLRFLSFAIILLIGSSCNNNDAQRKFEAEAYGPVTGFTETDNQQNIISKDDDDWRISPIYAGLIDIEPVFPNPLLYGSVAYLEVTLNGAPISSFMQLGFLNYQDQWTPIQQQDVTSDFDVLTFVIDSRIFGSNAELARGLHRLLLFDGGQRLVTYGDIQID